MLYKQVCETIVKNLPIGFTVIDEKGMDQNKDLLVEVIDTAVKIPRDQFPYIFEPFYREMREQKGSGL